MKHEAKVPEWANAWICGTEEIEVKGVTYTVHLMDPNMEPALPGFMGFPRGEFLFISEGYWPTDLRPYPLYHEIVEFTEFAGQHGRCLIALVEELSMVPADQRDRYIGIRRDFFRSLVAYYDDPDAGGAEDFRAEIATSLAHLEQLG